MRVLFFMRSTVYVRNFESTLRLLAERGHEVHVVAEPHEQWDPTDLIGRLCREYPAITHSAPRPQRTNPWAQFGWEVRRGLDYLRYLEPEYQDAPKLRRRADQKAPAYVTTPAGQRITATGSRRRLLARVLRWCDRAVPHDPAIERFVREQRADLVLVTPLVEPGSPQSEYLRAARALGVRTGLCVYSWDNLTNKGLIHDTLDLVTVWNQSMKDEAVALHGVPPDRIVVTGAAPYDHWFTWEPRRLREEFCARVGLDAAQPYILYLCSSRFIAPDEQPFIRSWIRKLRGASPALRDAGVLVRPHPQNTYTWRKTDLSVLGNVALWPRVGGNPVDADSRADYFDSIYHSAAVVGVNTSAQIESAIVGRGVYTLLAPEFRETQEGTLHFRHLCGVNGGLLHVAASFDEHVAQLEAALAHPAAAAERCRRFIGAFVRPHGFDEPATPRLVAALEATAAQGPSRPYRGPWWAALARPVLRKAGAALHNAERTKATRPPAIAEAKTEKEWKPKKEEQRAMAAAAFEHYLRVREHARLMRLAAPSNGLTPSEREMVSALQELWNAGPDEIANLRHYSKTITGVRRSYYSGPKSEDARNRLERDLVRLLEKGESALLVDEPPALGGFGFSGFGKTYNEDTLRFFRVVSLLQDASLIKDLRDTRPRRTVWEIGGGWGGLAYHIKTLCPDVTYLITATPDLFLVSAVYLMTLFPTARVRFYDASQPEAFWRDWDNIDFAFAPESAVPDMRPPSLDLAVDLMALESQSPARIDMHVRRAHDLGCRYFFSVCPVADPDPAAASPVAPVVQRWYWPHPVSTHAGLGKRLALTGAKGNSIEHTYWLGWRRLRA